MYAGPSLLRQEPIDNKKYLLRQKNKDRYIYIYAKTVLTSFIMVFISFFFHERVNSILCYIFVF